LPDRLIGKSLPRPDAHLLDYKIPTMSRKNGPLLRLMRDAGVEAFVTTDRNLEYQQNVAAGGFAVVVLVAVTNTPAASCCSGRNASARYAT
jgi:hypothetical protein